MNLLAHVRRQFASALATLTPNAESYVDLIRETQDAKHGDYQANCAMPLKKELGGNPRDIAAKLVDALPNRALFSAVEIAGPGFVNVRLADEFLTEALGATLADDRLGVPAPAEPRTMVIDYSSPNVAKPMHVGHLRSTVIGDAIARIHRALGWKVLADNHLGDWGTQFGMLIYGWRNLRDHAAAEANPLAELARLYRLVSGMADKDPAVAEAARLETAKLHAGDPENLALWKRFMPHCLGDLNRIYERLDIRFDMTMGESAYDPMLADTVKSLVDGGLAETSDGAQCIFFRDPTGKTDDEGKPVNLLPPFLIQKRDGAFTYASSDLACIAYRVREFHPETIVYVVDDRQSLHFQQLFAAARRWGYTGVGLTHVAFGKITGKDGKPFKTREGGTFGLEDLLDEAVARARQVVDELQDKEPEAERMDDAERAAVAWAVGHGAVKYADLSQSRASDYVFDLDKMVALQGNTAPYLQMTYARNRSIFAKAGVDPEDLRKNPPAIRFAHPSERALGLKLLQFPEALEAAAFDYRPNLLANYLYALTEAYNGFFRDCPVLKAETEELRASRLGLCELTARVVKEGLALLGIRTVERM